MRFRQRGPSQRNVPADRKSIYLLGDVVLETSLKWRSFFCGQRRILTVVDPSLKVVAPSVKVVIQA